jgi:hypothetical protein
VTLSSPDTRAQDLVGGVHDGLDRAAANTIAAELTIITGMLMMTPAAPYVVAGLAASGGYLAATHIDPGSNSAEPTPTPDDIPNVYLYMSRHPEAAQHALDAQNAGHPSILTIDRPGRKARSRQALRGYPTECGCERDEYPPAVFLEGGRGASVRLIDALDNSSAGGTLGRQLDGLPDGQRVRLRILQ